MAQREQEPLLIAELAGAYLPPLRLLSCESTLRATGGTHGRRYGADPHRQGEGGEP